MNFPIHKYLISVGGVGWEHGQNKTLLTQLEWSATITHWPLILPNNAAQ